MPERTKLGEFVREHIGKIVEYCEADPEELNNLQDPEYRSELGLGANYPFFSLIENIDDTNRYWNQTYIIDDQEYRVCSQWGGRKTIQNGKTRSQREGEKFIEYLSQHNLLLPQYQNKEIEFVVGDNSQNNNEENTIPSNTHLMKNIILYGVPGVGKTYATSRLISLLESESSQIDIFNTIKENTQHEGTLPQDMKERVWHITFHQSFSYEDFIEGFRPNEDGNITLQDGIFKRICKEASEDRDKNYYLVIDEINRGNISKIFGELITLIEEDKREKKVKLPYSNIDFAVPENLYMIGTMNSTDKSIALIDIALRRRFSFIELEPNETLVRNEGAQQLMKRLNQHIVETIGKEYRVGHSYFMAVTDENSLAFVKEYKIKPLLEEYYYGDQNGLDEVLNLIEI